MESSFFETQSIKLHGCRTGKGPLVVFLHGITANWAVWEPILSGMAGEATCVAVSQRGHGQSDKPAEGYGQDGFASDVHALIERLDLGPAVVVGHSLGSRNAVVAASSRPDLVRAVLAIDFVPQVERGALDLLTERVLKGNRQFDTADEIRAYLADRYRLLPDDAIARRAEHGFACSDGKWSPRADASAMAQTLKGLYGDYHAEYSGVRVPMLSVRGALSTLVSESAFAAAAASRADIEHVTVPGVDHYVPEEDPDAVMQLLRRLLQI